MASFLRRGGPVALVSLGLLLGSATALAAPSAKDKADAKELVSDAKTLTKTQHYEDAAAALRKADQLDPSPALELDLAAALAQAGHLLDATKLATGLADAPAATPAAKKLQEAAKKLAGELDARTPRLQVTVTGGPTDKPIATTIDGTAASSGTDVALDPGDHKVAADAEGFARAEQTVKLAEGAHEKVQLTLGAVAAAKPEEVADAGGSSKLPVLVAFGVGGAGLLVGAIFGGLAFGEESKAKSFCVGNLCSAGARGPNDSSKTDGNVATAAFVVGGVGVAAGVALLVLDPFKKKPAAEGQHTVTVRPWVGANQAGLAGRF